MTADWLIQALAASSAGEDGGVAMMGLIGQLGLTGAKVTVTDRSLLDRGLQATIDMQALGIDVPTYKQQLKDALPLILSSVVPPPIVEMVTAPLQSFIAGDQRLVAEISPPAPVLIPEIMAGVMDPRGPGQQACAGRPFRASTAVELRTGPSGRDTVIRSTRRVDCVCSVADIFATRHDPRRSPAPPAHRIAAWLISMSAS